MLLAEDLARAKEDRDRARQEVKHQREDRRRAEQALREEMSEREQALRKLKEENADLEGRLSAAEELWRKQVEAEVSWGNERKELTQRCALALEEKTLVARNTVFVFQCVWHFVFRCVSLCFVFP